MAIDHIQQDSVTTIAKRDALRGDPYSVDHETKEIMLRTAAAIEQFARWSDLIAGKLLRSHPGVPVFCTPPDGTSLSESGVQIEFQVANVKVPVFWILIQNNTSATVYLRFNRIADATGIVLAAGNYYEGFHQQINSLGLWAPSGGSLNVNGGIIVDALTTEMQAGMRVDAS